MRAGALLRVTMLKFLKVQPNFAGAGFGAPHALTLDHQDSAIDHQGRGST